VYGGVVHKKEYIGDPVKEIEPKDITRAGRLMYAASVLMLVIGILLRGLVIVCL
jgi:adenosylcobinamide-phosphate synthase